MLNDWDGSGLYVPYVDGAKSDIFYAVSADHNTKTITLADAKASAVTPTEPSPSDEVKTLIGALPEDITFNDKADVEAARTAYEALTDEQKALIDAETLQKLTDVEDALNAPVLPGDVDGDGEVTIFDVTLIQRYVAEMEVRCPIGEPII